MEIVINIQNVINDLGAEFLMESGSTDPIPPKGKLLQSLNEINGRLTLILGRYLGCFRECLTEDSMGVNEAYVYDMLFTQRRAANKMQPLTDQIHSFLVEATLAKTYSDMGLSELATKHDGQAKSVGEVIRQLINSKIPPR